MMYQFITPADSTEVVHSDTYTAVTETESITPVYRIENR